MRVWEGEDIRTIYQFHYIGWPDHGIPDVPSLLDLIAQVREYQPQHRPPLVVHCRWNKSTNRACVTLVVSTGTTVLVHSLSHCNIFGWLRDLSVRLGSRISPHRHRVVVEVHWHGAQGWRSISWVVATFNHVGGSFNLSLAATRDVWIIPSFRIWGYVLHVEHISCVITNCGQLQWAIPSLFSIAL